jgi:hypothetical protein
MNCCVALGEGAINSSNGGNVKGGAELGPEWAGLASLGPFWPSLAPAFVPDASRTIPYLCGLACGPLTSFPSLLRFESLPSKLCCFLVESLKICTLTLRSSVNLESCSSCVLTLVGLRDLLPKCFMNLSRKSPL